MVKVRFAPSPTGFLHIGGARTALFNWLYARAQNGQFVLRIEDTDLNRSEKRFEEEILSSLKWLGMDWDELYYQSERFDFYREHAEKLLAEGKAYKDGEAIILKMIPKEVKIYDLVRGEITFDTNLIKDQVLMKSDGSPAYSFCCVMDDHHMGITHVIRGEDHISNTPKQVMIYEALGYKVPKYAHLPLILGEDGSRMSKRFGAVAVSEYKQQGFISKALVNFLMLLGWSPGNNQEIVDLNQAIKKFSIKKVNKAGAVFNVEKLRWVNNQYLREMKADEIILLLAELSETKSTEIKQHPFSLDIIDLYKPRINTLQDFIDWTYFFFTDKVDIDPELDREFIVEKEVFRSNLAELIQVFTQIDDFTEGSIEAKFKEFVQSKEVKPKEFIQPIRVAVSGFAIGPSLFKILEILGKNTVLARLQSIVDLKEEVK